MSFKIMVLKFPFDNNDSLLFQIFNQGHK
uniref:Uncharacterized protein n=1 Tax=Anguilla anguilla TaxID=7936 RepID=A0A0E9QJ12_ANGAN